MGPPACMSPLPLAARLGRGDTVTPMVCGQTCESRWVSARNTSCGRANEPALEMSATIERSSTRRRDIPLLSLANKIV